jgi:ubiquinone/menaquinone biosynthesis C-methylase UbiE
MTATNGLKWSKNMNPLERGWWRLVKFGFRLLYNEMAFTYNWVANVVSLGQWWDWQRTALDFLPTDGLILELAHGTGRLQVELHQRGWRSAAIDLSADMGRIARRHLSRQGVPVRLARASAMALPFPDEAFSGIVATFPTEFIVAPETLAEVRRILVPGGRLVFVPNAIITKGGAARAALESAYRVTGQRGNWPADLQFEGFHVSNEVVELARSTVQVVIIQKPDRSG